MDERNKQIDQQVMDTENNSVQEAGQSISTDLVVPVYGLQRSKPAVKKKGTKDFTPEERDRIIKRARKIGHIRAAKEIGASWQAVASWIRADDNSKAAGIRRNKKFNPKEIALILARTEEVGARQAAKEFGTTGNAIGGWKRAAKLKAAKPATVKKPATSKDATGTEAIASTVARARSGKKRKEITMTQTDNITNSLELENAMLREKNAQLMQQVEKLKAMVADIAKMV